MIFVIDEKNSERRTILDAERVIVQVKRKPRTIKKPIVALNSYRDSSLGERRRG